MESSVNEKEHVEMVYIPQGELIKDEIIYSIEVTKFSLFIRTTVYHQKIFVYRNIDNNLEKVIDSAKKEFFDKIKR